MKARLKTDGAMHVPNTPAEFASQINAEIDKWTKLAKAINLKPQ
jgi:tripartite-type tricarboxylate transporter receptor subunit TctC